MSKGPGRLEAVLLVVQGLFLLKVAALGHTLLTLGIGLMDGELMLNKQAFIVSVLSLLFLLFVGFSALFWPERIQSYALEHSTSTLHQKVNPFLTWMRTRQYIWSLRLVGAMSVGAAVLLLLILIRHSK